MKSKSTDLEKGHINTNASTVHRLHIFVLIQLFFFRNVRNLVIMCSGNDTQVDTTYLQYKYNSVLELETL